MAKQTYARALTDTRAVNVDGIHILVGFALLEGIPKNKVVA